MIGSRRRGRWVPGLLCCGLALATLGLAAREWRADLQPVAISTMPVPAAAAGIPSIPTLSAVSLDPDQESAMLARPVFAPSRRPPLKPPAAPAAAGSAPPAETKPSEPPPPSLSFTLVGIVRDGAGGLALLKSPDGQPVQTLRAGQALQGWTLTRIGVDRASFRNGNFERELVLDFRKGAPPPP